MQSAETFSWPQYIPQTSGPDIKVESQTDNFTLFSPPSSPPHSISNPSTSSVHRRRRSSSLTTPNRARPYPILPRANRIRTGDIEQMATGPAYGSWASASSGTRGGRSNQTSSSDEDEAYNVAFPQVQSQVFNEPSSHRAHRSTSTGSSVTSSLTGAMGVTHIARSPPPRGDHVYNMQPLWASAQPMTVASHPSLYPGVAGPGSYAPQLGSSVPSGQYQDYRTPPESVSPPATYVAPAYTDNRPGSSAGYPAGPNNNPSSPYASPMNGQDDARRLHRRVRELEQLNAQAREQIQSLESQLNRRGRAYTASDIPPAMITPAASVSFQTAWKARTEARIRQFCSLNRAGNALCSWHDSRRERRVHAPRMAPPGHLNCGCTFEEALFEESLARHNVGSYLPGDSVRMDPALRNPLLRLLQTRYGYRDGDFERDPRTGDWVQGEGPAYWEQQVQAGSHSRRSR